MKQDQQEKFIICGCFFPLNFKRHAHSILESNSLLILISFFVICNIVPQKPPFFNIFGQKKTVSFETVSVFVLIKIFVILKLSYTKTFKKFDEKSLWLPL